MRTRTTFLVLVALCISLAAPTGASRLSMPLSLVAGQADLAFVGEAVRSEANVNDRGAVVTEVTFDVEDVLKGADRLPDPAEVSLRLAGGRVGDLEMIVPEVPRFEVGRRYIVLAYADGREYASPVVGMDQGLFRIENEPATGREIVLTADGRFVEAVRNGRIAVGSVARLDEKGRFHAPENPGTEPLPEVEGERGGVRVVAIRQGTAPPIDPRAAMTIEEFLAALRPLLAGASR